MRSQAGVEGLIEVSANVVGIHAGQPRPSFDQHDGLDRDRIEGSQLGYLAPVTGDGESLASLDALDHLPAVVA